MYVRYIWQVLEKYIGRSLALAAYPIVSLGGDRSLFVLGTELKHKN